MKKTMVVLAVLGLGSTASAGPLIYGGVDTRYVAIGTSSGTGYGGHVGSDLLPFIGIEGGYWNLGSFDSADYSTFYMAARPSITFGSVQLWAKGGLSFFDKDGPSSNSDNGTDLMYGLGVDYFFSRSVSVGVSYMNFGFDKDDADTYTFGITFHLL